MARVVLLVAFATAPQVFLFPKYAELLHVELPRFLDLMIYLPAVVLGLRSWLRTRSFARAWPLLLCLAVVWIGLLHAEETESQRGLLIAYSLTMVLPVAALLDEHRQWWPCARTFVLSSVVALLLAGRFEYRAYHGRLLATLVRFGWLLSEDGTTRLANPNPVGGQFAFGAVLAFVLYLRAHSSRESSGSTNLPAGLDLAWALLLSLGAFLTASRGAFFSWLPATALLILLGTSRLAASKLKDLVAWFGMLLAIALFLSISGSFVPWGQLYERTMGDRDDTVTSLGSRTYIWSNALRALQSESKFLYFGTGTGTADQVLGRYDEYAAADDYGVLRRNAHSAYVEWLLSYGSLGVGVAFLLAGTMLIRARQLDHQQQVVSRQAILLFLVLFSATIVVYRLSWWFGAGSLVLAMLTDPGPGRRGRSRSTRSVSSIDDPEEDRRLRPDRNHPDIPQAVVGRGPFQSAGAGGPSAEGRHGGPEGRRPAGVPREGSPR